MKIAIVGTGGVGGYYGGLLARAGQEVLFIARGPHLEAIRQKGLQVKSVHGDFQVLDIRATDWTQEVGPVDLILFTTKTFQTEVAARAIQPLVASHTTILPLQNGVDAADRIGQLLGRDHLLGGTTWVFALIEAPGVIGQYSEFRRIVLGELDGSMTPRVREVHQVLKQTGATVEVVDNISEILWTKFAFIASISAMGSLTRVPVGEYRSVPESRAVLIEAIGEVAAVAHAKGMRLPHDIVAKTLSLIDESGPRLIPSMQRDVEAGRKCELESIIGVVVDLGAALGVPTPVMRLSYAILKPGQVKAGGQSV
jgi:2-dehydropantoate 2-reductase